MQMSRKEKATGHEVQDMRCEEPNSLGAGRKAKKGFQKQLKPRSASSELAEVG